MALVSEVAQSCPTLCDPVDCRLPAFSVHGVFQARILEWVASSFSRRSSWPRDWTHVSCTTGRFFTSEPSGKSHRWLYICPNPHNVQSQEWTQMWTTDFGWWPVNAGSSVVTDVQLVGVVESGEDCACRGVYVENLCPFPSVSLWT